MTRVSIISAAYNSVSHIKPFIENVQKTDGVDYDLTIIDDGSTDDTKKLLKTLRLPVNVRCISLPQNKGATYARNFAANQSKGVFIVYFDIDARIQPDTIKRLIEPLANDNTIGMTQAVLLKPDGNIESTGHHLSWLGLPYNVATHYTSSQPVEIFGTRVAWAMSRELFEKIEGYDEQFVIYAEDTDISWRVWRTGRRILLLPDVYVTHLQKSSLNKKTEHRVYYEGTKNMLIMLVKNLSAFYWWVLPLYILTWLMLSVGMLFSSKKAMSLWVWKGLLQGILKIPVILRWRKKTATIYQAPVTSQIIFGDFKTLIAKLQKQHY